VSDVAHGRTLRDKATGRRGYLADQ
jgi:hypothetical protein